MLQLACELSFCFFFASRSLIGKKKFCIWGGSSCCIGCTILLFFLARCQYANRRWNGRKKGNKKENRMNNTTNNDNFRNAFVSICQCLLFTALFQFQALELCAQHAHKTSHAFHTYCWIIWSRVHVFVYLCVCVCLFFLMHSSQW